MRFRRLGAFHQPGGGLQGILPRRRLIGEHQVLRAVPHGVADVRHLRPGGDGALRHRAQQLRHHQQGLPRPAARRRDALLGRRDMLQPQIYAQVAPGRRDHVAAVDPVRQGVQPRLILYLGVQQRAAQPGLYHGPPHGVQLLPAVDKGLHHRRDAVTRSVGQVGQILRRQRRQVQRQPRQGYALSRSDAARACYPAQAAVFQRQHRAAVIDAQLLPRQQSGGDSLRQRQRGQCYRLVQRQHDGGDLPPRPHLRTAQVDEQSRGQARLPLRPVQGVDPIRLFPQTTVGQIQPEAGDTGPEQCGDSGRILAALAQCGIVVHVSSSPWKCSYTAWAAGRGTA